MVTDERSRWLTWKRLHPSEADDPATVWGVAWRLGWKAGVQDATRLDARLAQDLGQIASLLERLERHVAEYATREVEVLDELAAER